MKDIEGEFWPRIFLDDVILKQGDIFVEKYSYNDVITHHGNQFT